MNTLGRRKKAPDKPFSHSDDCKILATDPTVEIPWSEIRAGVWEARCVCGVQYSYESTADNRVRIDPYDPATSRHIGQCEYISETDPAMLRVLLKVKGGAGGTYWWVESCACDAGWQVPHYADSVG